MRHEKLKIWSKRIDSVRHRSNAGWGDRVEIHHLSLTLPRLDVEFDGFRLVQISDIHYGAGISRKRLAMVVDLVNNTSPDVVAITGDYVGVKPKRLLDPMVLELGRLTPKEATVSVMGNHDHRLGISGVAAILGMSGILDISNEVYTLRRAEATLSLAGVDSFYYRRDRLDRVIRKLPPIGAAILLAHEPDYAEISAKTGRFDMQISGHSHGGQWVLPVIGVPYLPRYARKFPSGKYHINGMVQYTNRGLGTSHLRLRINCPPEITVFNLHTPQ